MRQGGKKMLKLETLLKSQLRTLKVKQKMQNLLQRVKYSNKRKSQGKEDRVHPQTQNLRKLKGKEGRKNVWDDKGKENHLPHQIFQTVTPQQTRNQRL